MPGEASWDQSVARFAVTASIGGSSVAAGASATGSVNIPGASALLAYNSANQVPVAAIIEVTPAFAGGPGNGFVWRGYLDGSTTDQIDVVVTNVTSGSLTPTAGVYTVAVIPI